mgnify:CR=1 FL=1
MHREHAQLAVVMDEYGGTAGIITTKDLLDEVVGEMHEDTEPLAMQSDAHGRWQVSGTVRLEEIAQRLGVRLDHEEVESVGGLVLSLLDRPPEVGDAMSYQDLQIEVTAIEGHGVKACRISRAGAGSGSDEAAG